MPPEQRPVPRAPPLRLARVQRSLVMYTCRPAMPWGAGAAEGGPGGVPGGVLSQGATQAARTPRPWRGESLDAGRTPPRARGAARRGCCSAEEMRGRTVDFAARGKDGRGFGGRLPIFLALLFLGRHGCGRRRRRCRAARSPPARWRRRKRNGHSMSQVTRACSPPQIQRAGRAGGSRPKGTWRSTPQRSGSLLRRARWFAVQWHASVWLILSMR